MNDKKTEERRHTDTEVKNAFFFWIRRVSIANKQLTKKKNSSRNSLFEENDLHSN